MSHATDDHAIMSHKLFAMASAALSAGPEVQQPLLQVNVILYDCGPLSVVGYTIFLFMYINLHISSNYFV